MDRVSQHLFGYLETEMWVCRFTCHQKYIKNKNENQCIAFLLRGVLTRFGWSCKALSVNWVIFMHILCIVITCTHVYFPSVWLPGIDLSEIFNKQTDWLIQEHFHEFVFSKSFTSIFVPALAALMIHLINYIFNMICHSYSWQVTKWITMKFGKYSDNTAPIVIRMIGIQVDQYISFKFEILCKFCEWDGCLEDLHHYGWWLMSMIDVVIEICIW